MASRALSASTRGCATVAPPHGLLRQLGGCAFAAQPRRFSVHTGLRHRRAAPRTSSSTRGLRYRRALAYGVVDTGGYATVSSTLLQLGGCATAAPLPTASLTREAMPPSRRLFTSSGAALPPRPRLRHRLADSSPTWGLRCRALPHRVSVHVGRCCRYAVYFVSYFAVYYTRSLCYLTLNLIMLISLRLGGYMVDTGEIFCSSQQARFYWTFEPIATQVNSKLGGYTHWVHLRCTR